MEYPTILYLARQEFRDKLESFECILPDGHGCAVEPSGSRLGTFAEV